MAVNGPKPFWTGIFYRYFNHDPQAFKHAAFFAHLMDFILLYVLSGVILAYIKSIYSRLFGMKKTSKHVVFDRFTKFSLWLIFPLRLLSESFTATLYNNGGFLTQGLPALDAAFVLRFALCIKIYNCKASNPFIFFAICGRIVPKRRLPIIA